MKLNEFKAWFEGFTEDMDGQPSKNQWKRIKKRVSEIASGPTPYPVYLREYYHPYHPYQPYWWHTGSLTVTATPTVLGNFTSTANKIDYHNSPDTYFTSAGRAEQRSLTHETSASDYMPS